MADSKSYMKSKYPLPVYNYRVTIYGLIGSETAGFSEVSGLDREQEPVTYMHGLSFAMGPTVIPGMVQPITLTMQRGVIPNRKYLSQWMDNVLNYPALPGNKRDVLIELLDDTGEALITWKVKSALPVSLTAPEFDVNSDDAAIEAMELIAYDLDADYNP